ncbi:MAG: type II toxin-antitoxin system VapC family toxin [Mucilaginibacter sp.]
MASKVFLDANILLDLTLKREFYDDAKTIFGIIITGNIQAFTTPSVIHITGYWLAKAYGNIKAKELLLTLLNDVTVIDIDHEITLTALNSKLNNIEDALQYYAAIHHKIDYFISRDKQLQKDSIPTLPVYTPKEFIKEFTQ